MSARHVVTALALCLVAAGTVQARQTSGDAELKQLVRYCPISLERMLPGQYYFCAGASQFGQGHGRAARARMEDAARWASKPAQYVLGVMYINGDYGLHDPAMGVAWLALASERHDKAYESTFIAEYSKLSVEQRRQADADWLELRADYSDAVAGKRAQRRFDVGMRDIREAEFFGGSIFLDGITPPSGFADGSFEGGGGVVPSRVGTQRAFGLSRSMEKVGQDYFHGMVGTVTVGEVENPVPLGQVAAAPPPSRPQMIPADREPRPNF
ncbi:MAG TPA: hypothetical protein VGN46_10090 [Luteibacter sp.]|jgi:hypothetical protein|uniref:hypothetical protein n=1 Tax=Luteibacter sp. TaxID=1886636 RepID=UPI002F3F40B7